MKRLVSIILLVSCFMLQGCAYELGYAAGTADRYMMGGGVEGGV